MRPITFMLFLPIIFLVSRCDTKKPDSPKSPLFRAVLDARSNLSFANKIQESDTLNYYSFPYVYMGGGVAIGDFNNDGLSDIYVTGNMVENKLYINKGDMVFEDITLKAGVQGDARWYTGVSLVDVNYDGFLDIYLSVSGKYASTANQLFINKGDLTFEEKASEYGIDDKSNSIQSTFFDYDKDGDLDLFVANYPLVPLSQGNSFYAGMMKNNRYPDSGHLYRNDGHSFTEVTKEAGVQNFGLTLGLSSADLNNDGWPDLYLSNDFNVPDYFYLNNGDSTFQEVLKQAVGHTSMFGMGIDIADFTNDGLLDIVQADMTPEDYSRSKINMASMDPKSFWEGVELGFHYQYMQNSLQLNNGIRKDGIPVLGEISRMAGISTTDWSWSTLFADLDNDGWKDLFITNGMKRDVNDNDINDRSDATTFKAAFERVNIEDYPSQPLTNYAFKNKGDFTFEKVTDEWGLNYNGFSNGMAYGDLDNDGDLDLIINNLDQKISLFENRANTKESHYLRIKLKGPEKNPYGYGSRLTLQHTDSSHSQTFDLLPSRGFQSSMETFAHFGLGTTKDTYILTVTWPDGKQETQEVHKVDRTLVLDHYNANDSLEIIKNHSPWRFEEITKASDIDFLHRENLFDDFKDEPLLPHKYSTMGPGLAVGDINDDGLEDFYVGNATGEESALYIQKPGKVFDILNGPWQDDREYEDTGALFFDADADGDFDLYVVSGGHDPHKKTHLFQDRLYINTPEGFIKTTNILPVMETAGKTVLASDYDNDGDLDLFVGGANVPGKYPYAPKSYLLKNNGGADQALRFTNITDQETPELGEVGLITCAVWSDLNGDGWPDLIVAGEWMPIQIFTNNKGVLVKSTNFPSFTEKIGWWYGLLAFDVDNDGDNDLIAGNLGLNYKYKASMEKPFEVYASDFDKNGSIDIVLSQHKEGKLLPVRGRECSSQQIPSIKKKYLTYREFAAADLFDIYGKSALEEAIHYKATTFAHYWLENKGSREFVWHQLPNRSQLAPVKSIIPFDYDEDGFTDLLMTGNLYDAEVETPRADSGIGLILKNSKGNGFEAIEPSKTGLMVQGNFQQVSPIKLGEEKAYLFAGSNEPTTLILDRNSSSNERKNQDDLR